MAKEIITLTSENEVFEYLCERLHDIMNLVDEVRSDVKEIKKEKK